MVPSGSPRRPAADASLPAISPEDVEAFLAQVLAADPSPSDGVVADLRARGVPAEAVYCDLLAPVARRLGDRWLDDTCDFTQVTVALGRLQEVLRALAGRGASDPVRAEAPGTILVTALPGDQHSLGLYIAAECFVRDGWGVQVGHPLLVTPLEDAVCADWFDVVGLSVASATRLPEVRTTITRLRRGSRNPGLVVLVGGAALLEDPTFVRASGADNGIADARDAGRVARIALAARRLASRTASGRA